MYKGKKVAVVIPAAGKGSRIGGTVKKQFVELAGKPIWMHTAAKFESCVEIDTIAVVAPAEFVVEMKRQAHDKGLQKVREILPGGDHRQESVHNGLKAIRSFEADLVLVHDAVRPFVSRELILDVLEAALLHGAAVPGVQVTETVKTSNGNTFVVSTPSRAKLWLVQTPQGFRAELLFEAFEKAQRDHFLGTDDASLVERLGMNVRIVQGSAMNIKVTTPEDLHLAELFARI